MVHNRYRIALLQSADQQTDVVSDVSIRLAVLLVTFHGHSRVRS